MKENILKSRKRERDDNDKIISKRLRAFGGNQQTPMSVFLKRIKQKVTNRPSESI